MNLYFDPFTDLGSFGPYWAAIGILATACVVLFKKYSDAKNETILQAKEEYERNIATESILNRTSSNLLNLLNPKIDKT